MIHVSFYVQIKCKHADKVIWIRAIQPLIPLTSLSPLHSLLFTLSSMTQILLIFLSSYSYSSSYSSILLNAHSLFPSPVSVQCLCPALRDSLSWDTTMAQCPRRTLAPPVWSGRSFQTMSCSTPDEVWVTTATAGTRTESPTRGVSSDKTQEPLDGRTVTATRVRPQITRMWLSSLYYL